MLQDQEENEVRPERTNVPIPDSVTWGVFRGAPRILCGPHGTFAHITVLGRILQGTERTQTTLGGPQHCYPHHQSLQHQSPCKHWPSPPHPADGSQRASGCSSPTSPLVKAGLLHWPLASAWQQMVSCPTVPGPSACPASFGVTDITEAHECPWRRQRWLSHSDLDL